MANKESIVSMGEWGITFTGKTYRLLILGENKKSRCIMESGVKSADALHVACAILAGSDYFITTDDRLLKFQTEDVQVVTPGEFIRRLEACD